MSWMREWSQTGASSVCVYVCGESSVFGESRRGVWVGVATSAARGKGRARGMDDAAALADLGVVVRDSQQIEHDVIAHAQQAAEAMAKSKRAGKAKVVTGSSVQQPEDKDDVGDRLLSQLPSTMGGTPSLPSTSRTPPNVGASEVPVDDASARTATTLDADAQLAQILSQSSREMRVGVARRQAVEAVGASAQRKPAGRHEDALSDADDSEYVPDDDVDEDEDEEDEDDEEEEAIEDNDMEEGEIREGGRKRSGSTSTSGAVHAPHKRRRNNSKGKRTFDQTPYTLSDEEAEDEDVGHGMTAPGRLWKKLYEHQRVCLEWLCGLHAQNVGGIVGDDMCVAAFPLDRDAHRAGDAYVPTLLTVSLAPFTLFCTAGGWGRLCRW